MRKPQPPTAKPIRIPKTVFTSPHAQKTWSTLFWSLFHLPPYRDIKSREPLKHLHAHKIWGPSDLHLPHSAPYQRLVTWKYSHGLQHPSIILWQRAHHPHHEWLLSLKRMPPRRTSLSFSSVFLAGTVNALMDEKYEGEDCGGGGGPCVRIFSFLCYFDRKTWFMSSLMCGLGSLCRCILRTVTGSFVPVGDGGGGSCTCRRVLCYPMPLRPPVPEQKHPDKPCHLVLRPWFREGRGAADKTHWVSGQLLNEADS